MCWVGSTLQLMCSRDCMSHFFTFVHEAAPVQSLLSALLIDLIGNSAAWTSWAWIRKFTDFCIRSLGKDCEVIKLSQAVLHCILSVCWLVPLPATECSACLFVVHLAQAGLLPQSVAAYLSALHHLHTKAGMEVSQSKWPCLNYAVKSKWRECRTSPVWRRLLLSCIFWRQVRNQDCRTLTQFDCCELLFARHSLGALELISSCLHPSFELPAVCSSDMSFNWTLTLPIVTLFLWFS